VLSLVYTEEGPLQVENILPDGFDYKAHPEEKQIVWGDKELVADIYNSRGSESFSEGNLTEALYFYRKALTLNPVYTKARLNMGLTLVQLGEEKEATTFMSREP
jgi:tetratricopeptide (TPR) repeat protein